MAQRSTQVVVLGAGYAGLNAALHLADRAGDAPGGLFLTLVDQRPYHLIKVRLHEAASHDSEVHEAVSGDRLEYRQAVVTGLDFGQQRVLTGAEPIGYDYLLLALGSVTNFFNVPGLAEHSFALDSLSDTVRLRGHVLRQIVLGADSVDARERDRRLCLVIGGAGFTGVELAAELAEDLPAQCERVGLARDAVRIVVVDGHDRILPTLDEDGSAYAAAELRKKGVELRLGVHITGCDERGVTLTGGETLPSATTIWAGGILANPLMKSSALEAGRQGRVVVDTMLRVAGHNDVFAAGDCALALGPPANEPVPATAQLGLQAGRQAAENILHTLRSEPLAPFDPESRGEIVSLGHDRAVGWTKALADRQIKLRGLVGGLAKRFGEAEWELHLWRETHHLDDILG